MTFYKIALVFFLVGAAASMRLDSDEAPPRISNMRDKHHIEAVRMSSMDQEEKLATVVKAQAETFALWADQFEIFKNNVLKYMETNSHVMNSHNQKIKTLQNVVKKIAADIDEKN